jgi:hypothetical protein
VILTAFTLGFFTALGWWSATKVTDQVDKNIPVIEKKEEKCQRI